MIQGQIYFSPLLKGVDLNDVSFLKKRTRILSSAQSKKSVNQSQSEFLNMHNSCNSIGLQSKYPFRSFSISKEDKYLKYNLQNRKINPESHQSSTMESNMMYKNRSSSQHSDLELGMIKSNSLYQTYPNFHQFFFEQQPKKYSSIPKVLLQNHNKSQFDFYNQISQHLIEHKNKSKLNHKYSEQTIDAKVTKGIQEAILTKLYRPQPLFYKNISVKKPNLLIRTQNQHKRHQDFEQQF